MFCHLPHDVLTYHVGIYLDQQSRINLNEILPRKCAIVYKFSKEFIDSHHRSTTVQKFKSIIGRYEFIPFDDMYTRHKLIYRLLQEVCKPINRILFDVEKFKQTVIDKVIEFQATERYSLSSGHFYMFQRQCTKTLQYILSL